MKEMAKVSTSVVTGIISAFFMKHVAIIALVLAAVIFDTITGIVATLAEGKKLDSKLGTMGFWKKMALMLALCFGFFLDAFLPYCLTVVNLTMPQWLCFGMVFGCYIILNESISILENLKRSNPEILPKWVIKLLTDLKDKIEDGEKKNENQDKNKIF